MWNLITSAAKNIFNALTAPKKAAPAPAPAKPKPAPKPSPIQQVISGVSNFFNNPAKAVSQQQWLPQPVRNAAGQIAQQQAAARAAEAARQAAIKEQLRRQTQAAFNQKKDQAQKAADAMGKKALGWFQSKLKGGDWRNYYDEDGKYKGGNFFKDPAGFLISQGQGLFDPRVKNAKDAWSNWYNTTEDGKKRKAENEIKSEYDRVKKEYYDQAKRTIDGRKNAKSGWFSAIASGKTDEMAAREVAAKALQDLNKNVDRYNQRLKDFNSQQTKQYSALQAKLAAGTLTQQEADSYNKWVDDQVKGLEYTRAAQEGQYNAYKEGASAKLQGAGGQFFEGVNKNVVEPTKGFFGNVWKYTLGEGDENVPSVVTAPGRAVNWIGNSLDSKRTVNQWGGTTTKMNDKKNAWQASFNQKAFNRANPTKQPFDLKQAEKEFGKKIDQEYELNKKLKGKSIGAFGSYNDPKAKDRKDLYNPNRTERLKELWEGKYVQAQFNDYVVDAALDPVNFVGGGARQIAKWVPKAAGALNKVEKVNKVTSFVQKTIDSGKSTKFFTEAKKGAQWLNSESKTRAQKYFDATQNANKVIDEAQTKILPRVRARAEQLQKERKILEGKFDDSVLDDFRRMAEAADDQAAKWLQQMKNGDFTASAKIKNWTRAGGVGSNPRLTVLKDMADRYGKFSEMQRKADDIAMGATRFGKGKKSSFYSPRTKYFENIDDYNFKAFKKNTAPQSAQDLYRGMVDRYFKSDVIDHWGAGQKGKVQRLDKQVDGLLKEYDMHTAPARAAVDKAYRKTRTPLGRAQGFANKFGPTALWKKSVLKYRPAWSAYNMAYNVQGAALAGGTKAIVEQFKNLNPRYLKKAMQSLPEGVAAEVANELGKGKLSKFYNNLENSSRVAAFKGAKAKGLTDEQALKRVNNYLFDYKTKNYERPLKAVMPFYGWAKNVSKASARMPFDRPLAAQAYNKFDRVQSQQYDQDFEQVRGDLKELGYTDEQINEIKEENRKYYKGKLKVGDKYMNTPFSVFSERGAGEGLASFNPYLMAGIETASGKDTFGRTLEGSEANPLARLRAKFPQLELGKKTLDAYMQNTGKNKPIKKWIGAAGSDGFGLTKEMQGFDPTKPNYSKNMDANKNLKDDWLAFAGKPRTSTFDKNALVERKRMEKVKTEYFATNSIEDYNQRTAAQDAIFKKYGVTPDQFFKGELSKYDSDTTKAIKVQKEDARKLNKQLFEEYSKQSLGTRGTWAVNKLRELTRSGYFDNNPYLKSFDWLTSEKVKSVDKTAAYKHAKSTGDWTAYNKAYGDTRKISGKKAAYDRAKSTGNWTDYRKKYGDTRASKSANAKFWQSYAAETDPAKRRELLRQNPQFAKRQPKTEAQIAEAKFWAAYSAASKDDRKRLLAENPAYNRRADWKTEDWDVWKKSNKEQERAKLRNFGMTGSIESFIKSNTALAAPVAAKKEFSRGKRKVVWKLR